MEPARSRAGAGTTTRAVRRVGGAKPLHSTRVAVDACLYPVVVDGIEPGGPRTLAELADSIREASFDLATAVVEAALRDEAIPSLDRLGEPGQLGDMPNFIGELARELVDPQPSRVRPGSPLAALVREHAREREALGFAPREVVTEFLLLRRVLGRFVSERSSELDAADRRVAEQRLDDSIDRLVIECVVAYFDRVTGDLAYQAHHDPLTGLLNHQAFTDELDLELERAARYGHGLTVVYFDLDRFKQINDTRGHPEGDRVLRILAGLLRETVRRSDRAGRMGGDEFAVILIESEPEAGRHFLTRLGDRIDQIASNGDLPAGFSISPGLAHYPTEVTTAEALIKLADTRMYEAKRRQQGALP